MKTSLAYESCTRSAGLFGTRKRVFGCCPRASVACVSQRSVTSKRKRSASTWAAWQQLQHVYVPVGSGSCAQRSACATVVLIFCLSRGKVFYSYSKLFLSQLRCFKRFRYATVLRYTFRRRSLSFSFVSFVPRAPCGPYLVSLTLRRTV